MTKTPSTAGSERIRDSKSVLSDVFRLRAMHKSGALGGEVMPEDAHPGLARSSRENFHYFTLTMALNYQRNSYKLWPAATKTIQDGDCGWVFNPEIVAKAKVDELRDSMLRHGLALQPNKHPEIWMRLCSTFVDLYEGDVRTLFDRTDGDVGAILTLLQEKQKKSFPYLSGNKICHYWLHVMEGYTSVVLKRRKLISVAPDTHVVQASIRLGLVDESIRSSPAKAQQVVSQAWKDLLSETDLVPIDVHTPLWLWSKAGLPTIGETAL